MRYKRLMMVSCFLCILCLMTGCGSDKKQTVTGTNYYYPKNNTESVETEENRNAGEAVKAEFTAAHYMIISNDMSSEHLIIKQMESGRRYLVYYSLSTNFLDKYGNRTSAAEFEPGRIITVRGEDSEGKLKEAQISEDVWEYEDVVRYEIDEERGIFKIADTKYSFGENVYVVSDGSRIALSDIKKDDELRVIGMNKEIISVSVTTGHGTISLKNTEIFEGSFIQVGKRVFAEITGEIELEVPEGTYMVTVANKGYGGSKEYEIKRNAVTVIDLDELKGEGPKMGSVTFEIGTADEDTDAEITFKIDGEEVGYAEPVALAYGLHSITASAFGYDTYAKKLFVNSEQATITITLDVEENTSSATAESRNNNENEENGLAGSLAGSISNGETNNSTNAENNASENNSASENRDAANELTADYLSTLTELLGNVMN